MRIHNTCEEHPLIIGTNIRAFPLKKGNFSPDVTSKFRTIQENYWILYEIPLPQRLVVYSAGGMCDDDLREKIINTDLVLLSL
jgi:hypothetical protein